MKTARALSRCTSLLLAFLLSATAFSTALAAGEPGDVVFSELMWMGSESSSADEWIELYNRGSSAKDLGGWTITQTKKDGEESVMLQLGEATLAPGAAFLISNYNAARSQISVEPDVVATAVALPNSKLLLRLYDGDPEAGGNLIDSADDGTGAPPGRRQQAQSGDGAGRVRHRRLVETGVGDRDRSERLGRGQQRTGNTREHSRAPDDDVDGGKPERRGRPIPRRRKPTWRRRGPASPKSPSPPRSREAAGEW